MILAYFKRSEKRKCYCCPVQYCSHISAIIHIKLSRAATYLRFTDPWSSVKVIWLDDNVTIQITKNKWLSSRTIWLISSKFLPDWPSIFNKLNNWSQKSQEVTVFPYSELKTLSLKKYSAYWWHWRTEWCDHEPARLDWIGLDRQKICEWNEMWGIIDMHC